jgi:hypothetical protein
MRNRDGGDDFWIYVIAIGALALFVYTFLKWLGGLLHLPVATTLQVVAVTGVVGLAALASGLWADSYSFWHIRKTWMLLLAVFLTFAFWPALDAWNTISYPTASLLAYDNDITPMKGDAWWDSGYLTWPGVLASWAYGLYVLLNDR